MHSEDHAGTGPAFSQFRGLQPDLCPVYPNLVDILVNADAHPDARVAYVLGSCAGYAYATREDVSTLMMRMGLPENRCRMIAMHVDPMFVSSTAFLVQSSDGRAVILAYRGTEPINFINWLTDLDVNPDKVNIPLNRLQRRDKSQSETAYAVHGGFYRNVRATWDAVIEALERALDAHWVDKQGDGSGPSGSLEALYITGHSLGGAMAALMTLMLLKETPYARIGEKLRAVYTFGQPMIGEIALADACDDDPEIRDKVFRYVYRQDIVPHLPPKDTGQFKHFGREYRYHDRGLWKQSEPSNQEGYSARIAEAPLSFLLGQFPLLRKLPFRYKLDDHLPHRYIDALIPQDKPNEFCDRVGLTLD